MKKIVALVLALLWGLPAFSQGMPVDTQGAACIASATAPTFTQGNWGVLSCDLTGGLRISGGGGGGGGGGTVTQGPAAADTAANRWPVLAYQGGTWSVNLGTLNGAATDATLTSRFGTLGQKASSGSAPVVLASDQPPVPVSGTVSALNLGVYNSTAPTITSGAQTILQASSNGSLFVDSSRSSLPDNAITTYNVTGVGTQTGVLTTGYGSVLVEMTGTFTGVVAQVEASTNTTNGIDGTWTALVGINPEDTTNAPTSTLLSGAAGRRKLYHAQDGVWLRFNTTSYGTGTAVVNLVRRTAPIAERISYVVNFPATQAVSGSLTNISGTISLPTGASTAANQTSEIAALGAPADTAYVGTGSASQIAALKGLYAATFQRTLLYADGNNTAIAANAFLGNTQRDVLSANGGVPWTKFNAVFLSNQTGTAIIQGSNDGSNFVTVYTQAITAGTTVSATVPVAFRYYYARLQNGTTAATGTLATSFAAN